ncbi:MAG TPA: hypothetical protein H9825_09090 [Candidatus Sphingobacterium stercorigallinarum]|nr:hypothetical protein [Candidatus Sphingobacterium stercorigallinarum]
MLEIFVNGMPVDLSPDIQIALTIENPFMLEDRIPLPYSIAFDLPPTASNLKLFNYPNRIGAYCTDNLKRSFPCEIRFASVNVAKGQLKLTSYLDTIKVQFVGADVNEDLRKKMYEFDFGRLEFQGEYDEFDFMDPDNFAYRYKNWASDAAQGMNEKLVVAPLAIKNTKEPESNTTVLDYGNSTFPFHYMIIEYWRNPARKPGGYRVPFIHQDDAYINMYNPSNASFAVTGSPGTEVTYAHANIYPLYRVGWLIEKLFDSQLINNPFLTEGLENLVIPTHYFPTWFRRVAQLYKHSPEQVTAPMVSNMSWERLETEDPGRPRYEWQAIYDGQPYIDYADFMPSIYVNELLKELLKLFSFHLVTIKGKFSIKTSNEIVEAPVRKEWSTKLIDRPEIDRYEAKEYEYGYSERDYVNYDDADLYGTLETIAGLGNIDMEPGIDEDDIRIYYVTETNSYYKITSSLVEATPPGIDPEEQDPEEVLTIEYLGMKEPSESSATDTRYNSEVTLISPPIVPAPFFVTLDRELPGYPDTYFYNVPMISLNRTVRPESVSILYFDGQKPINTPIGATTPNYPSVVTETDDFSLDWEGENGLIAKYHEGFKKWIEKDKVKISAGFLLTPIDLHQLDITEKIHVDGRNFFIEKIQVTLSRTKIDPAWIELIEV